MATILELLEAVNTKEAAVSTTDLANELKASKEGILKQLTREKDKGNVEGDSQDGWLITERGRKALESGDIHPTMIDEGVTPRQQFEAIGRRIGIKEDRIVLASDMVWSGDYEDVIWVWNALGREGADLADDLRRVWANAWRAKLHKGIPPELETELTGVNKAVVEAERGDAPSKPGGRDFIIIDDEPVRIGENLGDYSLQDAKDILVTRALRSRFSVAGQSGKESLPGAAEKVSDVLSALAPYINKGGDDDKLREVISLQLELQKQEILSHIPQPGQPSQPKPFMEQITEFVTILGTLRESGSTLKAILGIQEPSGNSSTGLPVQIKGPDGQPFIMDLGQVIDWRKFQSDERRADERHGALVGLSQTIRENISDGISALRAAAEEVKGSSESKAAESPPQQPQVFKCGDCQTEFSAPPGWIGEPILCPKCRREYTKEELLG